MPENSTPLETILCERYCFLDEHLVSQEDVFAFVGEQAKQLNLCDDSSQLTHDLKEREKEQTTGLMDGIAIPHAKSASVIHPSIIVVRNEFPISWETLDGAPVQHIFALLVPEQQNTLHLEILSRLATNLLDDDFKRRVLSEREPHQLSEYICKKIYEGANK